MPGNRTSIKFWLGMFCPSWPLHHPECPESGRILHRFGAQTRSCWASPSLRGAPHAGSALLGPVYTSTGQLTLKGPRSAAPGRAERARARPLQLGRAPSGPARSQGTVPKALRSVLHCWGVQSGRALGALVPALGLSNKAVYGEADAGAGGPGVRAAPAYPEGPDLAPAAAPGAVAGAPLEEHLGQSTLWPETAKLYGHAAEVCALAADPRGAFLASACRVRLRYTGNLVLTFVLGCALLGSTWARARCMHMVMGCAVRHTHRARFAAVWP